MENEITKKEFESSQGQGEYLVVDLSEGSNASNYPICYTNDAPNLAENVCRTTELWLRRIPAGSFMMGSSKELGRFYNETQHKVTLTQDYYIGIFPCTQRQYALVTGDNPSHFNEDECCPVECVSYDTLRGRKLGSKWPNKFEVDRDSFFGLLQARTELLLDLPTEAEWEYACRANTKTALNNGKNLTSGDGGYNGIFTAAYGGWQPNIDRSRLIMDDAVGWYCKNSGDTTHPVGKGLPNDWGLYDMLGNVWEWCLDWYGNYQQPNLDPVGAISGTMRVSRGGCWNNSAEFCRAASRGTNWAREESECIGFRIAVRP